MIRKPILYIIEGARGGGKSTLARMLREKTKDMTLINLTGDSRDSEETARNMFKYHYEILEMINSTGRDYILDRSFFTEMVMSQLYKTYDFKKYYDVLMRSFKVLSERYTIVIVHMTVCHVNDLDVREKYPLFGNMDNNKDTHETFEKVTKMYTELFKEIYEYNHIHVSVSEPTFSYSTLASQLSMLQQ